jgi:hypothetical protein
MSPDVTHRPAFRTQGDRRVHELSSNIGSPEAEDVGWLVDGAGLSAAAPALSAAIGSAIDASGDGSAAAHAAIAIEDMTTNANRPA